METYKPDEEDLKELQSDGFQNSVEFIALENEMHALVKKADGDDKNLTEEELERRKYIYEMLRRPPNLRIEQ